MKRKAQIKMMENVGVLIVFFVLIAMAMIFYFAFQSSSIEEKKSELSTRNALELANRISMLPEIQCRKNNVAESHCFDRLKMDSAYFLFKQPANQDYYFQLLGFSTIKVKSLYPIINPVEDSNIIYSKTMPEFTNNDTFSIPISVYYPIENIYGYGLLEVNVYS